MYCFRGSNTYVNIFAAFTIAMNVIDVYYRIYSMYVCVFVLFLQRSSNVWQAGNTTQFQRSVKNFSLPVHLAYDYKYFLMYNNIAQPSTMTTDLTAVLSSLRTWFREYDLVRALSYLRIYNIYLSALLFIRYHRLALLTIGLFNQHEYYSM